MKEQEEQEINRRARAMREVFKEFYGGLPTTKPLPKEPNNDTHTGDKIPDDK